MTHTPGPWTVYQRIDEGYRIACATMAHAIADIDEWHSDEETRANACLIAAAPDLLAALRDCLADAEGYLGTHGAGPVAMKRIRDRCDRARTAIARATGTQA